MDFGSRNKNKEELGVQQRNRTINLGILNFGKNL